MFSRPCAWRPTTAVVEAQRVGRKPRRPNGRRTVGGRANSAASASSRCFVVLVLIPVFFSQASQSFLWTRVLIFAIAGCSLTILTGWAGQLSLGQFGFCRRSAGSSP